MALATRPDASGPHGFQPIRVAAGHWVRAENVLLADLIATVLTPDVLNGRDESKTAPSPLN
jgi:hypothetical protein